MKRKIRNLLLMASIVGPLQLVAQQHTNPAVKAGHFEIDTTIEGVVNHVNVNYELSPIPMGSIARIMINTSGHIVFNVDILNAANHVVATWSPTTSSNYYQHEFNIASLPPGNYHVNIRKYSTPAVLHTIDFSK